MTEPKIVTEQGDFSETTVRRDGEAVLISITEELFGGLETCIYRYNRANATSLRDALTAVLDKGDG